jgi:2-methylfumaryl-CoA hydratase
MRPSTSRSRERASHCSAPLARALGHRACPLDDFLRLQRGFRQDRERRLPNAVANLGYADVRFLAPVYAATRSPANRVIGAKANSNGKSGVVYVRSRAVNQDGAEVLTWARWVMVQGRARSTGNAAQVPSCQSPLRTPVPLSSSPSALGAQRPPAARASGTTTRRARPSITRAA